MFRHSFLVFVALGAFTVIAVAQDARPAQDRVQELLKRIEKLEARVKELEQLVPRTVVPASITPPPQFVPNVPRHWIPQEFNGQTYYIIPLTKAPQAK